MKKTLYWKNGYLYILNQLLLPRQISYIRCAHHRDVARAITTMAIRGAPAIGVAAAFGVVLAAREKSFPTIEKIRAFIDQASACLAATRPTAVNLFWALNRMRQTAQSSGPAVSDVQSALEQEALRLYNDDIAINHAIGKNGTQLLKKNSIVLTHCNAGALATAGYGTALGVIRAAHESEKISRVYVDETRPYLQGARLTAWELQQEKIPFVLITDNMAGHFMKTGGINAVIVGADRIAANGDTANKIGTYSLSILARYHGIPLYIAAPTSTIDWATPDGGGIIIEERPGSEVMQVFGKPIAPHGTRACHPGFDVTPAENITAIITEIGVCKPADLARQRDEKIIADRRRK